MFSPEKQEWIDAKIKERQESLKEEFWRIADPTVPVIDAGTFAKPLAEVTRIVTNKVERDGQVTFPNSTVPIDVGVILRQLHETYNLISWVNADDIRFGVVGYRTPYSFVILPLVRTMIDGFYNATAMLDDPVRARKFRITGSANRCKQMKHDMGPIRNGKLISRTDAQQLQPGCAQNRSLPKIWITEITDGHYWLSTCDAPLARRTNSYCAISRLDFGKSTRPSLTQVLTHLRTFSHLLLPTDFPSRSAKWYRQPRFVISPCTSVALAVCSFAC